MNKAAAFLKDCGTFYLATLENDQPRVRPFGAIAVWDGKTYICTNNTKPVFDQMTKHPKVEVSGTIGSRWIRIAGEVVADRRAEARQAMLDANPGLSNMYRVDDGRFEVLYFKDAVGTIFGFGAEPEDVAL